MKKLILILSIIFGGYSYVASQCSVDISPQPTSVNCGDCVTLTADGQSQPPVLSTDFNNNQLGTGWASNVPVQYNNPCGPPPDGSAAAWFGSNTQPREVVTNDFAFPCGGEICFEMRYEVQGGGGNCEGPDQPDEGVDLMYSTDGGATWTSISYWDPNGGNDPMLTTWNEYCLQIPPGAQTGSTRFRWFQDVGSGANYDHWGLDNVEIIPDDCSYYYDWAVDGTQDNEDTTVCPTSVTDYVVLYTDGADSCFDTATVSLTLPDIDPYSDQIICNNYTLPPISGTNLDSPGYYDAPNGGGNQFSPGDVFTSDTTIYAYDGSGSCSDQESFDIIVTSTLVNTDTINYQPISCPNASDGSVGLDIQIGQTAGGASVNIQSIEWTSPSGTVTTDNGGNGQTSYVSTQSGMEGGIWSVVITMDNGCDYTLTVEIEEVVTLNASLDNVVELDCFNEDSAAVNISVSGGSTPYQYQWDDANNTTTQDIDELPAGTYEVVVTDDNGCTDNVQVTIDNPSDISVVPQVSCDGTLAGNSIEFTASGGLPADQGSGGFTIINTGDGQLSSTTVNNNGTSTVSNLENLEDASITVVDGNGCEETISVTFLSPEFNVNVNNATNCSGTSIGDGELDVNVVGGSGNGGVYGIDIDGNVTNGTSASETGLLAGTNLDILVSDNAGCVTDSSITIGSNGISIDITEDLNIPVTCNGGADGQLDIGVQVNQSGGSSFVIDSIGIGSPPGYIGEDPSGNGGTSHTVDIDSAYAGTWTITVELDNGCMFTNTFQMTEPDEISGAVVTSGISCYNENDGSIDLTVTGGTSPYDFQWTGPVTATSEDLDQIESGVYECLVTDDNGCTTTVPVELVNAPVFTAEIETQRPTCHDGEDGMAEVVDIEGNNGSVSYVWSTDNPNPGGATNPVNNLLAGTYTVQLFDQNGCDTIIEFDIPNTPPFEVNNIGTKPSKCRTTGVQPGTGQVTANIGGSNGGVSVQWTGNGQITNTPTWANRPPGTYTYTATDIKGCTYTGEVVVDSINPEASFDATPVEGNAPLFVDVTNTSSGIDTVNASYKWTSGFGSPNSFEDYNYAPDTTYTEGGDYIITLVVQNEYGCTDSAAMLIEVFTPLDFKAPNVFTPNQDGSNDTFYIPGEGISPDNFSMRVFGRWGGELYTTTKPGSNAGWDGTNKKGKNMPEGVYFYLYELQAEDGSQQEGKGFVHLLRGNK